MKILAVSQYYYPENFKINEIAKELVRMGHTVTVLTGLPNYPAGYVPKEYRRGRRRCDVKDGVKIIRTMETGRRRGAFFLALNYISFAVSSSWKAFRLKEKYDVVYIFQPSPVFSTIPALIYKKRHGANIFLYLQDLWPESLKTYEIKESSIIYRSVGKLSRYLYQHCDIIGITSKQFEAYLTKIHEIKQEKIYYLPQHAEDEYLDMDFTREEDGLLRMMFCGNIGRVQNIECIIEAASILHQKRKSKKDIPAFEIHIVGDGSNLASCRELAIRYQLEDVIIFHGRHPGSEMPRFYKMADILLLTLKGDSFIGMTLPAKLQGYMAVGKPVLGAINGSARDVIEGSGCGRCAPADDIEAFSKEMEAILKETERYREYGECGRKYFREHFMRRTHMEKLEEKLYELCGEKL